MLYIRFKRFLENPRKKKERPIPSGGPAGLSIKGKRGNPKGFAGWGYRKEDSKGNGGGFPEGCAIRARYFPSIALRAREIKDGSSR